MKARQRTPGAADRVESPPMQTRELFGRPFKRVANDLLGLLQRAAAHVLQRKAAERHGDALADARRD